MGIHFAAPLPLLLMLAYSVAVESLFYEYWVWKLK